MIEIAAKAEATQGYDIHNFRETAIRARRLLRDGLYPHVTILPPFSAYSTILWLEYKSNSQIFESRTIDSKSCKLLSIGAVCTWYLETILMSYVPFTNSWRHTTGHPDRIAAAVADLFQADAKSARSSIEERPLRIPIMSFELPLCTGVKLFPSSVVNGSD